MVTFKWTSSSLTQIVGNRPEPLTLPFLRNSRTNLLFPSLLLVTRPVLPPDSPRPPPPTVSGVGPPVDPDRFTHPILPEVEGKNTTREVTVVPLLESNLSTECNLGLTYQERSSVTVIGPSFPFSVS